MGKGLYMKQKTLPCPLPSEDTLAVDLTPVPHSPFGPRWENPVLGGTGSPREEATARAAARWGLPVLETRSVAHP